MTKASEQARLLYPYLLPMLQRALSGNGGGSSGGAGIGGAPSPHTLSGAHHTGTLADSQAPQFLKTDGSRKLTGHLAVNTGITIDGVDLGAFKGLYDLHVADPDAHHARATVGSGLSITGQQLSVNQGFAFSWTGIHAFNQDIQLDADLDFVGPQAITTTSGALTISPTTDLALVPGGDIQLNPTGDDIFVMGGSRIGTDNYASQLTGWRVDYAGGGDFRYLYTDELHAKAFIADLEQALAGGQIITKSVTILAAAFTAPAAGAAATIIVKDLPSANNMQVFQSGDIIRVRQFSRAAGSLSITNCWGVVTSYVDGPGVGEQSWTFTRSSGANAGAMTTGTVVAKDAIILDYGTSGNGFYEVNAIDGVYAANSPYAQVVTWTTHPATGSSLRMRIGNLAGVSDAVVNPTGYGLYSDNAFLKGIVSAASDVVRLDGSGARIKGQPSAFDPIYGYEFRNSSDVELGGVYLRYTDSTIDTSELSLRALGSTGIRPFASLLADSPVASGAAGNPLIFIQAQNTNSGTLANITLDVTPTTGTITFGATTNVQFNPLVKTNHVQPVGDSTFDLGTASLKYRTLYVDSLVASTISGATLAGQTWSYPASMTIDAVSGSNTLVSVANSGAGRADFDVDRNITLGGTIDGVDLSGHVASASAHHDPVTAGSGISVSTQVVSVDSTVVRTTRTVSAGDGMSGGGALSGNITLAVDATVVRTSRTISVAGAIGGGGDLSANRTISLTLATLSGLNQTSGLAVGAGSGISVLASTVAVDSTVVRTTLTVTAGGGLAGGGALSGNITLDVGAGSGITVNANDVAVDSTVVRTTRTITSGAGLTGGGALSGDLTLAVGAGTGITVNADDVAVNQAFSPTWTGSHTWNTGTNTFNTAPQIGADLAFIGASRQITTASTFDLSVVTGGDIILNPTGTDVLPGGSIAIDLGDYNRKWRTIFASELYVETLVAADVLATVGGQVMVAPTTSLLADINTSATTITVKHNGVLAVNGFLIMQTAPGGVAQFEAMKITASLGAGGGGYQYTVVRNQDGTGANSWVAGDAVVYTGNAAGEGYIDLAAVTTVHNHIGPTITVYSRSAATNWNDVKPVVTMGNLDSFLGYGTEYGFAAGNDLTLSAGSGFSGFSIDRTSGMKLYDTSIDFYSGANVVLNINKSTGIQFRSEAAVGTIGLISWYDAIGSTQLFKVQGYQSPNILSFSMAGNEKFRLGSPTGSSNPEFPGGIVDIVHATNTELRLTSLGGTGREWAFISKASSPISGSSAGDLVIYDYTAAAIRGKIDSAGEWTFPGGVGALVSSVSVTAPYFRTVSVNINDDSVYTFTPGINIGVLMIWNGSGTAANTAIITYRTVATITCQNVVAGSAINAAIGTYTGTTGTDGKLTVAVHGSNGSIQIENRLGGTTTVRYMLLG